MKKVFKVLLCISIMSIFGIKGVKAYVGEHVNLTKQDIDNVWSYHYRNGEMWSYGQLPFRYANDKLVYCIQPDVRISTNEYIIYDFNRSGYDEEAKQKMELISYYGYKYDNHNDLKYYIATQDLIWRLSPDEDIKWTTGGEYGTEIDISKEKNEILSLISKHNVLPEFNNSINEVKVNEKIELIDNNNVLDNYDIEYSSDIEVIRDNNNKLIITPKKEGEYIINFIHKKNYDSGTFLYDNFNTLTQSVAVFGAPSLVNGSMKVIAKNIDVNIYKKDKDTKELIYDEGITIRIKDLNNDIYLEEYVFKDGVINISLPVGKYRIEEIKTGDRYKLNDGLEFEITNQDSIDLDFFNEKVIMPITSTECDCSLLILLFDFIGYAFIKKIR